MCDMCEIERHEERDGMVNGMEGRLFYCKSHVERLAKLIYDITYENF